MTSPSPLDPAATRPPDPPPRSDACTTLFRTLRHELDNSLAPILSLARSGRSLLDRPDGRARVAAVLDTIADRAEHLQGFLHRYLEAARLPAPRPRPTRWAALLERLARLTTFRFDVSPFDLVSSVDEAQIEQALLNLLKNAVEAGGPRDEIEIVVGTRETSLRIAVLDRGPGIPADRLALATRPFWSTRPGGTGLGLALTREIAEAHGGALQIANRPGGGLEVTLTLPAPAPPAA